MRVKNSKLNVLLGVIMTIFMMGCNANDPLEIVINRAGSLLISAENVDNGKLTIREYNNVLVEDSLSSNGQYQSESLLEGNYYIEVKTSYNNFEYSDSKVAQVIAGQSKEVKIAPLKNIGDLQIFVYDGNSYYDYETDSYVYTPKVGVFVGVITKENYVFSQNAEELINKTTLLEMTNSEGIAQFNDIPSYYNEYGEQTGIETLMVIVLDSSKTKVISYDYIPEIRVPFKDVITYSLYVRD